MIKITCDCGASAILQQTENPRFDEPKPNQVPDLGVGAEFIEPPYQAAALSYIEKTVGLKPNPNAPPALEPDWQKVEQCLRERDELLVLRDKLSKDLHEMTQARDLWKRHCDDATAEANRRDEKWKIGLQAHFKEKLDFDNPSASNCVSCALDKWAVGVREYWINENAILRKELTEAYACRDKLREQISQIGKLFENT
jgi:hypothetical protein